MKLCIPTTDERGLEAVVADHFGGAPFLTLVDEATGQIEIVSNGGRRAHGTCRPAGRLDGHGVDAVVSPQMGRRALAVLEQAGYRVYRAPGPRVGDVMAASKAGSLTPMTVDAVCGGHGGGCGGRHHQHRHGGRREVR